MKITSQFFYLMILALSSCAKIKNNDESQINAITWPRLKSFDQPTKVNWKPSGIRKAHEWPALFPEVSAFRAFHSDQRNSNQVISAYAPMFKQGWVAETQFYIPEGPSFDEQGNVYFVPIKPPEDVFMVSLDGMTGRRRFAIPGKRKGQGGAPLVLKDPSNPSLNILYFGSYEYTTAVRSDGKIIWDVPTGLKASNDAQTIDLHNFGVNYLSQYDALVASMGDGSVVVHDRKTGRPLLKNIFVMPGAKASGESSNALTSLPPAAQNLFNKQLSPLFETPENGKSSSPLTDIVSAVVGGGAKVANYFGVDPTTNRMWFASTALDGADGKTDGVSEFGAIYGLEFVPSSDGGSIKIHCSKSFAGGSASSPSLRADGKRIYVADAFNKVIAINDECQEVWSVDVGTQILGSLATSDSNGEIYAAGPKDIFKIVEDGDRAKIAWQSSTDIFNTPLGILKAGNLNLAGISSNGVVIQAGAGIEFRGHVLPTTVALVMLDRVTGKVIYGATGREEGIAAMTSSSDGSVYLAHSPIRRAIAHALTGKITEPVIGGVGKYEAIQLQLLARDAACAAKYRADNLTQFLKDMPAAAISRDFSNIQTLVSQAQYAANKAFEQGDLSDEKRTSFTNYLSNTSPLLKKETLAPLVENLTQACALID